MEKRQEINNIHSNHSTLPKSLFGFRTESPISILIILILAIFIAEGSIMYLLYRLPPLSPTVEGIFDALLMTVLIFPLLYLFVFRPLVRQLTIRKQTEKALQMSKTSFNTIVNENADGILVLDKERIVRFMNPAAEKLLNQKARDFVGQPFNHPIKTDEFQTIDIIRQNGDPGDGEIEMVETKWEDRSAYLVMIRDVTVRKEAEIALRESIEQFRSLALSATDAIIGLDEKGQISIWNESATQMFGFSEEEAIGSDLHKLIVPEAYREKAYMGLKDFYKSGTGPVIGKTLEFYGLRKDGNEFPVELSISSWNKRGSWRATGIIRDITDRKAAEEEALRSEERIRNQNEFLENVIESLVYPFYVINVEDYTIQLANSAAKWNREMGTTTCYSLSHGRDKPCESIDHPCPLEETKRTGKPAVVEHIHLDKQGNPRNVEVHTFPIFDKDGKVIQVIEYSLDITERKAAEEEREAIRRLSQRLTGPISIKEIGQIVAEESRKLFKHDAFSLDLLDESKGMLLGVYNEDTPLGAKEPEEVPSNPIPIESVRNKDVLAGKPVLINRAEEPKLTELSPFGFKDRLSRSLMFVPILWEERTIGLLSVQSYTPGKYGKRELEILQTFANQSGGALTQARAQEALKHSEEKYRILSEQLTDANNMKDLLLDVITHDLKNPAGVIHGMSDVMLSENPDDEMAQIIKNSSDNLLQVIKNASTLAEISLGEEIEKGELDLAEMIEQIVGNFIVSLQDKGMSLEYHLHESLPVKVNPIIAEVFKNYISNAIKYAAEGKKIVIEAEMGDRFVTIAVKDFGKKIPEKEQQRIFERKTQLEPGIKRGRGLGLAIVKRIAEAHGGEVWVEPNKPTGNIFYLKLPRN